MNDYLLEHKLITRHQHGFLKRHSTSSNLLESFNDWTLSLSRHNTVIIASIDFQRAFDSLSHAKLIHKLTSYGISGNLLYWLKSFLTNRTQCVRVGQSLSSSCQWLTARQCNWSPPVHPLHKRHFWSFRLCHHYQAIRRWLKNLHWHIIPLRYHLLPTPPQSYPLMVAHLATKHCFLQMQHYATWRSLYTSPVTTFLHSISLTNS